MKTVCAYCDKDVEERDITLCSDCLSEGCFACIDGRHCCNGYGFEEYPDEAIFEQDDEEDEED